MKICTWSTSLQHLRSDQGWNVSEQGTYHHHTKKLTFNFTFCLPIFSQTPIAAVSESFTNHLVRPQKTQSFWQGREVWDRGSLWDLSPECPSAAAGMWDFPIWFSLLQMGSLPCRLVTCDSEKAGFHRENMKISYSELSSIFLLLAVFKQNVIYAG